jgi:hypothetical protein
MELDIFLSIHINFSKLITSNTISVNNKYLTKLFCKKKLIINKVIEYKLRLTTGQQYIN